MTRSELIERGDLSAEPGSRPWSIAMRAEIQALIGDNESSANHLRIMVTAMEQHAGYQQLDGPDGVPFQSFVSFCTAPTPWGLGYDPDILKRIIHERETAQARADKPKNIGKHRRPTTDEQSNKGSITTFIGDDRGADYLTARIARDRPDILQRMQSGEYGSVLSAAVDAGIRKRTVQHHATPEAFARAARKHLTDDQIVQLVEMLEADG